MLRTVREAVQELDLLIAEVEAMRAAGMPVPEAIDLDALMTTRDLLADALQGVADARRLRRGRRLRVDMFRPTEPSDDNRR